MNRRDLRTIDAALSEIEAGEYEDRAFDGDHVALARAAVAEALKPGRVIVVLTAGEAERLSWLAGELMSDPPELRKRIGGAAFGACCRACGKLTAAIHGGK